MDVPQPWLMLDFDSFPASIGDLADDPLGVVEEIIRQCLPGEFQDATCWWQLSSSCGFVRDVAKAHLWFWLAEERTCADLRYWFEVNGGGDCDLAVFNPIQLLYTANAILDGVVDPLPVRGGWRYGDEEAVAIPAIPPPAMRPRRQRVQGEGVAPSGSLGAALEGLGDGPGLRGFHAPLRRAAMVYANEVTKFGRPRDDAGQIILLQSCIELAPCRDNRRDRYLSDHYLADLIRSAFEVVARD